jgi:hypothetical protein
MPVRFIVFMLLSLLVLGRPTPAVAQVPFETTGTRPLGLGGAFVAVADDSSAPYWNPAGLPAIRFFDATLEGTSLDLDQSRGETSAAGWQADSMRVAAALPVLAFTYYRLQLHDVRPVATVARNPGRQDVVTAAAARAFHTQHFGLTLVQSLGDAVVVGSTLRFVRGGAAAVNLAPETPLDEALEEAEQLDVRSGSQFDADVGVLGWMGRMRVGLVVRNVVAPEFDIPGHDPWQTPRQARAGVAYGGEPARGQRSWTMALDADLTKVALPDGDRRSLAAGAERWWAERRVGIRGGARLQTVGDARPAASAGISLGLRAGFLLEAHVSHGGDDVDRGWSMAGRLTF